MNNSIHLKNVTKRYKDFALENISLDLPQGCIMGLIGENGAGKSTLLRIITGLADKDEGTVEALGSNDIARDRNLKEHIGVALDKCAFSGALNADDVNKIMSGIYKTWNKDAFSEYVERFKLSGKKKIKDYSRGMTMKLSIAAALSHDSKLLILDEATSGLDPIVRDEILDILLDFIQDETHSVLMSSHIVSDLEKACDYIAFLHQGRLVFCEEKDELLDKYAIIKCTGAEIDALDKNVVYGRRGGRYGAEALVLKETASGFVSDKPSIEDIMVFMGKERD
jgi:ABC-2 type transport system ATP-binding protein